MQPLILSALSSVADAYAQDRLIPGSFQSCTFTAILRGLTGRDDARWGVALSAYINGNVLPEHHPDIHYYENLSGFSVDQIHRLEAAFEGAPMVAGVRRKLDPHAETLDMRVKRTVQCLEEIEAEMEQNISAYTYHAEELAA